MLYGDYVRVLANQFETQMAAIEAVYNFDLGDEFEVAFCKVLRSFLPLRYGICRGFCVATDGETAGDDIIIYDQQRFPTLRLGLDSTYALKQKIPIEAVFAYIEAKHTLTGDSVAKAISQVQVVKKLIARREAIIGDPQALAAGGLPVHRLVNNLFLTMIVGRKSQAAKPEGQDSETVAGFLTTAILDNNPGDFLAELVVAGPDDLLLPVVQGDSGPECLLFEADAQRRLFGYQCYRREGLAFGIALAHLFAALDRIQLGPMPWLRIVNEAITGSGIAHATN